MTIDDNIEAFQECYKKSINYEFSKDNFFSTSDNTPFEENMLILLDEKKSLPFHKYVASFNGFDKLTPLYKKYWDEVAHAYNESITDTELVREKWINYLTANLYPSYFEQLNTISKFLYNPDYYNSDELQINFVFFKNLYCGFYPEAYKIYESGKISLRPFQNSDKTYFQNELDGMLDKLIDIWGFYFKIQLIDVIEVSSLYKNDSESLLAVPKVQYWNDMRNNSTESYGLKKGSGHKHNAEALNKKFEALKKECVDSTQEEIIKEIQVWYNNKLGKEIDEGTIRYHTGLKR